MSKKKSRLKKKNGMRIKKTLNKGMKPGKANDKKEKEKE